MTGARGNTDNEDYSKGVTRLQIAIRGKNVDVTNPLREYLQKRLSKIERHFASEVVANVSVATEPVGYSAEITIPINGLLIRAEERSGDLYSAIDLVVDKLIRQINRFRGRIQARRQALSIKQIPPLSELEQTAQEPEANGRIVKVKRFPMRPMPAEEAILQMNLLSHDFFVFASADSGHVSVVYRRRDGNYGLIEPEH